MSILLIHAVGFTLCTAVVVIGAKSVYAASQVVPDENDYLVDIPLEDRNITADVVGLGVEIVGYGLDTVGDATENLFNSRATNWLRGIFSPVQIKPDGKYFKYKNGNPNEWAGYGDDTPKVKPGKFEMEI